MILKYATATVCIHAQIYKQNQTSNHTTTHIISLANAKETQQRNYSLTYWKTASVPNAKTQGN